MDDRYPARFPWGLSFIFVVCPPTSPPGQIGVFWGHRSAVKLGGRVAMGQKVGTLGKEGGSGPLTSAVELAIDCKASTRKRIAGMYSETSLFVAPLARSPISI